MATLSGKVKHTMRIERIARPDSLETKIEAICTRDIRHSIDHALRLRRRCPVFFGETLGVRNSLVEHARCGRVEFKSTPQDLDRITLGELW